MVGRVAIGSLVCLAAFGCGSRALDEKDLSTLAREEANEPSGVTDGRRATGSTDSEADGDGEGQFAMDDPEGAEPGDDGDATEPADGDNKTVAPDGTPVDNTPQPPPTPPTDNHPPVFGLETCDALGTGRAAEVASVSWRRMVRDCPSSACWEFFALDKNCVLRFQRDNEARSARIAKEACVAVRNALTTDRFFAGLKACWIDSKDTVDESFEIDPIARQKLSMCRNSDVELGRDCLRTVVHGVFPDVMF